MKIQRRSLHLLIIFLVCICTPAGALSWSFFGTSEPKPEQMLQVQAQPITFTLMIDPAGDARDTGREIDDSFERSITMQCAEELKKSLESHIPGTRVILTKFTGETVEPLQNAAFANRLNVELYLSLHFYETKDKNAKLHLYHVLYNAGTDFWGKKSDELTLLPYDQAYKLSIKKTENILKSLFETMKKEEKKYALDCSAPIGLPFKPLAGIRAPALGIEIGIKKKDDWKALIPFFVAVLEPLIQSETTHGTPAS